MGVPNSVCRYLERNKTAYDVLNHTPTTTLQQAADACELPLNQVARAVVLIDGRGLLMVVLPTDHVLDFEAITRKLGRILEPVPAERLATIFDDCEPGSCPPLGEAYGLDVLVDDGFPGDQPVAFEPGSHDCLVQVSATDFQGLLEHAQRGRFSRPVGDLRQFSDDQHSSPRALHEAVEQFTPARLRQGIEEFHDLPPLPATAQQILELAADPNADARRLAVIVEQDAPLAAQILRYANSAMYGYAGGVKDLQTAIARVLGFDFVMNLALGLSIGRSLKIPADGPLGLEAFWNHSVYAARLVEKIALELPADLRPSRGGAYLAGLLQNLGTLALGHTFQPEFFLLNRFVLANPHLPICELERHVLGVTHNQIGAWLMEAWGMPAELVLAVREHHNDQYLGEHTVYPNIVLLANRLLRRQGIGAAGSLELPASILAGLGLTEERLEAITEELLEIHGELDELAHRLAA